MVVSLGASTPWGAEAVGANFRSAAMEGPLKDRLRLPEEAEEAKEAEEAEEAVEEGRLSAPQCSCSLLGRVRRSPLRLPLREPDGDECGEACDRSIATAAATHSAGSAPGSFTTASTRSAGERDALGAPGVGAAATGACAADTCRAEMDSAVDRLPSTVVAALTSDNLRRARSLSRWSTEPRRWHMEGVNLGAPAAIGLAAASAGVATGRLSRCASTASTARESSED